MPKATIDLTTASDGQYLLFEYDYDLGYAFNNKNFSPLRPTGGGTAFDFGFTVGFMKQFQVDFGLVDLGGINFKSHSSTVSKTSSFRYEGLDMNQLVGVSSTIYLDSLYKSLGFDAPQPGTFRMNLGSRMVLQGTYEIGKETDLKDKGRVFLTYIQGFQERPFSTRRTYLGAGYAVAAFKWLELGTNLGFGGFNRYAFGMLVGLKLGKKFTMAISSENILGTFIPGMASGVDIGGNLIWNFDVPGQASPPPGLPLNKSSAEIDAYLKTFGISYLLFVDPDVSTVEYSRKLWTKVASGTTNAPQYFFDWSKWHLMFIAYLDQKKAQGLLYSNNGLMAAKIE
jgi:hypothetical protein